VGELADAGHPFVVEAEGLGDLLDLVGLAGEEVPAAVGAGAVVLLEVRPLLALRELPRLVGVDADEDDVGPGVDRESGGAEVVGEEIDRGPRTSVKGLTAFCLFSCFAAESGCGVRFAPSSE
jgi:hypothetical protein